MISYQSYWMSKALSRIITFLVIQLFAHYLTTEILELKYTVIYVIIYIIVQCHTAVWHPHYCDT